MSLQVWLPLTKDLRQQGLSNATVSIMRGNETWDNNGKLGKCFYANGVNTLQINNIIPQLYNANGYSLCAWFYIESQNTVHSGAGIISGGNWNNQVLNLSVSDWSSDHYTRLRVSGTNWNNTYTYNFYKNIWYHAVVCSDGNKTYAYINGQLIGDTVAGFLPSSIEGNNIAIGGATYYSGMQFFGKINDVRIYDHCLSPMEVKELAKGLVLHYPLNRNGWGQENLFNWTNNATGITLYDYQNVGSFTQFTNSLSFDPSATVGKKYTISFWAKSPNGTTSLLLYNSNSKPKYFNFSTTLTSNLGTEWQFFKYTVTNTQYTGSDASTNTSIWKRIEIYAPSQMKVQVKQIKVEEGEIATPWCPNSSDVLATTMGLNSTTEYDCSGFCNNGTRTGTFTWTSDTPKYQVSQVFSGSQYIVEPNEISTTDSTIALWVKSALSANAHVLDARNSSEIGKQPIYQYTNGSIQTGGNNIYVTTNTGLLVANTWVHIVLVQSGNSLLVYKNGVLFQTLSCTNSPIIKPTIGARLNFSNKYTGQLSDLRVYATALSASDVKSLYQNSAYIDSSGNVYGTIHEV